MYGSIPFDYQSSSLLSCRDHFEEHKMSLVVQEVGTVESSANNASFDFWMYEWMSLEYTRKSNGPSIEPWGTPDVTGSHSEYTPSRTTLCCLSDK